MNPLDSLPPPPVQVPGDPTYADRYNAWVQSANTVMNQYKAEYAAAMAQQGIAVTFSDPAPVSPGSPVLVPPTFTATLSRDGYSATSLISIGRAQQSDPSALAAFDATYNLKWNAQVSSPQGSLPTWFAPTTVDVYNMYNPPSTNPYIPPSSAPGPAATVPLNTNSLIPNQSPNTPNSGTIVTAPVTAAPTANEPGTPPPTQSTPVPKFNFWEWNWYYEQESGRVGPSPEAVGVADPTAQITRAEWWAKVSTWYGVATNGTTPAPAGSGGGNGGGVSPGSGGVGPGSTGGATPTPTTPKGIDMVTVAAVGVGLFLLFRAAR